MGRRGLLPHPLQVLHHPVAGQVDQSTSHHISQSQLSIEKSEMTQIKDRLQ